ncbi:MAG: hypothetical protein LLF92_00910 [Planctomycetaceae bacterium]|nr:hypothetical protein [Planctomycetaceae bacterium]
MMGGYIKRSGTLLMPPNHLDVGRSSLIAGKIELPTSNFEHPTSNVEFDFLMSLISAAKKLPAKIGSS